MEGLSERGLITLLAEARLHLKYRPTIYCHPARRLVRDADLQHWQSRSRRQRSLHLCSGSAVAAPRLATAPSCAGQTGQQNARSQRLPTADDLRWVCVGLHAEAVRLTPRAFRSLVPVSLFWIKGCWQPRQSRYGIVQSSRDITPHVQADAARWSSRDHQKPCTTDMSPGRCTAMGYLPRYCQRVHVKGFPYRGHRPYHYTSCASNSRKLSVSSRDASPSARCPYHNLPHLHR